MAGEGVIWVQVGVCRVLGCTDSIPHVGRLDDKLWQPVAKARVARPEARLGRLWRLLADVVRPAAIRVRLARPARTAHARVLRQPLREARAHLV